MKFHIKDEDGKSYDVEEIIPAENESANEESSTEVFLSQEEIAALKKLAMIADKLAALVVENKENEESTTDGCDENEAIIDTDEEKEEEKKLAMDSKKSFGAIEKPCKTNDAMDNSELEIEKAWAKRYGGNI